MCPPCSNLSQGDDKKTLEMGKAGLEGFLKRQETETVQGKHSAISEKIHPSF